MTLMTNDLNDHIIKFYQRHAPAFRLYSVRLASAPTNLRYLRLCSVGYFIHAINGSSHGCFLRQHIQHVQPIQPYYPTEHKRMYRTK